jgi:2-polyprenyl-3-methyl-5-hydroxy-6-metoxy-1,4-benzoquinol methylase
MNRFDYSIYYRRFHDDSDTHAETMATMVGSLLVPHLPADRSARIIDVGCGYGFALRAMRNFGYTNLLGLETSPEQAERSKNAGFEVVVTDDSIGWLKAHRGEFAFVCLLDVLEHVPIHLEIEFARAIHEALFPTRMRSYPHDGGTMTIRTIPASRSILYISCSKTPDSTKSKSTHLKDSADYQSVCGDATPASHYADGSSGGVGSRCSRRKYLGRNWMTSVSSSISAQSLLEQFLERRARAINDDNSH